MAKGKGPDVRDAARAAASAKGCIKEAFLKMYEAAPLKEIGAEALARKAGYSRAAFYRYFHSVADVLRELQDESLPSTQSSFIAQHAESITPSLFIGLYLEYFRENERVLRILLARDESGEFYHKLERSITPAFYAMSASMYPISTDGLEALTSYLVQTKMNQLRSWAHNPTQPLADYMRLPLETVERSFWKMDEKQ